MPDPLSLALEDLSKKEEEIKRLQGEAGKSRAFVKMYRSYTRMDISQNQANGAARPKKDDVIEGAAAIIKRERKPVPLSALFSELEANGVEIGTSSRKYVQCA